MLENSGRLGSSSFYFKSTLSSGSPVPNMKTLQTVSNKLAGQTVTRLAALRLLFGVPFLEPESCSLGSRFLDLEFGFG